jgi:periplasmic protein TonB
MFTNLIESQSHRKEFKRRGSFVLFTVAAYAVILFGAGIGSIYAYDAQLEAQTTSLEIVNWVPPVTPVTPNPIAERLQTTRRAQASDAPVDPNIHVQMRTVAQTTTDDPSKVPEGINTKGIGIPPVTDRHFVIGEGNFNPPSTSSSDKGNCTNCPSTSQAVVMPDKAPEPIVKPPATVRLPSQILTGKAISLPQPPYPIIAKQSRVQGAVSIQILVSEEGKVLSAQAVSGNAMLMTAAKEAALRARFSPTILNGAPVKVQGVITYNFTLQ